MIDRRGFLASVLAWLGLARWSAADTADVANSDVANPVVLARWHEMERTFVDGDAVLETNWIHESKPLPIESPPDIPPVPTISGYHRDAIRCWLGSPELSRDGRHVIWRAEARTVDRRMPWGGDMRGGA